MYNEQIEALISAALADGMLTEKEKQVLFKKAQAQGIDLDEFEIILDARLVELEKAEKAKAAAAAPKSNKLGDVKKCPVCGAIVQSFQGVCTECGYSFEGVDANLSSLKLCKKIEGIQEKYNAQIAKTSNDQKKWELNKEKINTIAQAIKTFPLPTTKADLLEFLTTMQANMLNTSAYKIESAAYFSKYTEALLKSSTLFKKDSLFSSFIENKDSTIKEYNKKQKKQKSFGLSPDRKSTIGFVLYFLSPVPFFILMYFLLSRLW